MVTIGLVLNVWTSARAQGWSADVAAGRLVYHAASVDLGTNTLMGTLRFDARRDAWVYGTAAAPMDENGTFWTAGGTGGRVMLPLSTGNRVSVGADVGGHGFVFNDRVADLTGTGGAVEALPFARVNVGASFVEGRAGWLGQTLAFGGVRDSRGVFETGVRAGYGGALRLEGNARFVHASEGTYPFVGATVAYRTSRLDVWGHTGKWRATNLDDAVWALGTGVALGPRTSVWGSVRQEASDPLYWNTPRRTWSIGLTQRLGRIAALPAPVSVTPAGTVVITLAASDAPNGAVRVAGDFNNWQSIPMVRDRDTWVLRLPLSPGVYHYTFQSATGEWFVPESAPGRRDDGFGGSVAVLVVN